MAPTGNRGRRLRTVALRLLVGLLPLAGLGDHIRGTRPHIVLVVSDALRAANLGCYGYGRPTSPTIDRLAAEGVLFEQAIAVGGNTTTSMAGAFTGHYAFFEFGDPWTVAPYGMERFRGPAATLGLPASMTTLAEALEASGYQTVGIVTNPYVGSTFAMEQGFGHFEEVQPQPGAPYAAAASVSRRAVRFVRGMDTSRPSFLYLHLMDTHGPYRDVDAAETTQDAEALAAWKAWSELSGAAPGSHATERAAMMSAYDAGLRRVDEAMAHVLRAYEKRGLLDSTLVVFTADHGEEFLEHGGTTHKGTLFEELVHVPLVVRAPGAAPGRRWPRLVRSFDVGPTLLDYAGCGAPGAGGDARSLRPVLEGRPVDRVAPAYAGFPGLRMLRGERYKLLRRADGSELFFDLRRDPGERVNLADATDAGTASAHRALAGALDATVDRLRHEGTTPLGPATETMDEATRAQLRALGYVD